MACVECQPLWWGLQITVMLQTCNSLTHWFWPRVASPPPPQRPFGPRSSTKKEAKKGLWVQKEIILSNLERLAKFCEFCSVLFSFVEICGDILGVADTKWGPLHGTPSTIPPLPQNRHRRHSQCAGGMKNAWATNLRRVNFVVPAPSDLSILFFSLVLGVRALRKWIS